MRPMNTPAVLFACAGTLVIAFTFAGCGRPDINEVGGYIVLYQLPKGANAEQWQRVAEQRLSSLEIPSAVSVTEDNKLEIALPGAPESAVTQVMQMIESRGELEFRILAKANDAPSAARPSQSKQQTRWVTYDEDLQLPPDAVIRSTVGTLEVQLLVDSQNVTGADFARADTAKDAQLRTPIVRCVLSKRGAAKMAALTSQHVPNESTGEYYTLAVILDGHLITAPRIMTTIADRFQISANFSQWEAQFLAGVLRAGALPGKLDSTNVDVKRIEPSN